MGEYRADELAAGLRAELIDGDYVVSGRLVAGRKTIACPGGEVGFTVTPVPVP